MKCNNTLDIWTIINAADYAADETGVVEIIERIYPEGTVYLGKYVSDRFQEYTGPPRFWRDHAELDAMSHIYFLIIGKIDWARQALASADSHHKLSANWVIESSDYLEATIRAQEQEMSNKFTLSI